MFHKKRNKFGASGQAAIEYLLVVAAVFITFTGVTSLFARQVDGYLSLLIETLRLPF
jgi:hypothetical protein